MSAIKFKWHKMADERPTDTEATYLLIGKGGGMYVALIDAMPCGDGSTLFRIPNNRKGQIDSTRVKAWAEIPPFEGVSK